MRKQTAPTRSADGPKGGLRVLAVLGRLTTASVVYFDLGPPLAFTDDRAYAWSVRQLSSGHGLRVPAEQVAAAVPLGEDGQQQDGARDEDDARCGEECLPVTQPDGHEEKSTHCQAVPP